MSVRVGMVSLGCAKNRVDSEQMLGLLQSWGYTLEADPAKAEVIIVNTCGFIAPAKEESIDTIFEMAAYKRTGRCKRLVVTGCLAQRYGEALHADIPEVDAILGVGEYPRLRAILAQCEAGERPLCCTRSAGVFEAPRVLTTQPYSAYIRVSDGCDNRCAYCAIPLIRGGYRSRAMASVLAEAHDLAARGVREITLIAQDTTRFGDDTAPHTPALPALIREISAMEGVDWVRALYCYPSRVDDALLDVLAHTPKACKYLDVPLQHIDERLLRAMNRQGSPDMIRTLLRKARALDLTLRTTFIVGFPGEDEAAFERLYAFVEETAFDRMGAFAFSPEEDTPAATMPNQVPEDIKQERLDKLMRLQQRISLARNTLRVGTTCRVLVERSEGTHYIGRSEREAPETDGSILFSAKQPLAAGTFADVRITQAAEYDLIGECV